MIHDDEIDESHKSQLDLKFEYEVYLLHNKNKNLNWAFEVFFKVFALDMLRYIGKQSGESVESVLKKKRKATAGRICRKGRL